MKNFSLCFQAESQVTQLRDRLGRAWIFRAAAPFLGFSDIFLLLPYHPSSAQHQAAAGFYSSTSPTEFQLKVEQLKKTLQTTHCIWKYIIWLINNNFSFLQDKGTPSGRIKPNFLYPFHLPLYNLLKRINQYMSEIKEAMAEMCEWKFIPCVYQPQKASTY